MKHSLSARLILLTTALIAFGLVITSFLSLQQLKNVLISQVDSRLELALSPLSNHQFAGQVEFNTPLTSDQLPSEYYLVFQRAGETFGIHAEQTDPASLPELPEDLDELVDTKTTLQSSDGSSWRMGAVRLQHISGTQIGTVAVGLPLTSEYHTLASMQLRSTVIGVSIIIAAAIIAFFIIRRTLQPLQNIRTTAQKITKGDFTQRVNVDSGTVELTEVADSFNTMLKSIEDSFTKVSTSQAYTRQFMADASHELRTPLTAISGYTELIRLQNPDLPQTLSGQLQRIESAAARMQSLVDQLLLLTRLDHKQATQIEETDLLNLAVQALDDLQALDSARATQLFVETTTIHEHFSPAERPTDSTLFVAADPAQLHQIVTNLIANAVKHTPQGSPVELHITESTDHYQLRIIDHGPGIAREQRDKIFQRFYRADPSRSLPGNGLGLAIVAQAAEHNNIDVSVTDTDPHGATFTLHIPKWKK